MQSLFNLSKWFKLIKESIVRHWKSTPYFFIDHCSLSSPKLLVFNRLLNWSNARNSFLFSIISFFIHIALFIREGVNVFGDFGAIFFILYHFSVFFEVILTLRLLMDWNPSHNPQDSVITDTIVRLTDPYFGAFSKYSSNMGTSLGCVILFDFWIKFCRLCYKLYVFSGNTYDHELAYGGNIEEFELFLNARRYESLKFR